MTATALGTVVGAHRPLTRQALLCLGAGAVCVVSGLGWLPSGGAPIPEMDPWTGTAIAAFIVLFMLLSRRWRSGEVVSISLGAFSNQDEMLDAIRRRLEAAAGPPVEVVPA